MERDSAALARRVKEQRLREQQEAIDAKARAAKEEEEKEFDQAWEELIAAQTAAAGGPSLAKGGAGGTSRAFLLGPASPPAAKASAGALAERPDSRQAMSSARKRNLVNHGQTTALPALPRFPGSVLSTWRSGPADAAGKLCDVSDRPTLCSAANWPKGEVVVGSSDHALYVIDAAKGTKKRQLYNKSSGHQEWVTAVAFTPDGKIVSGGMDSQLWLWPANTTRGIKMDGHFGPVSHVQWDGHTGLVVSCSYDKTVRLWQCGSRGEEKLCLHGHEAPVMHMDVNSAGKIITGDRSGHVILWDTSASDVSWRMKGVHKGQVSALAWCDAEDSDIGGLFMSGGQDGVVRAWDHRQRKNPAKVQLHVNPSGHGAVSSICAGGKAAAHMVVTCGADKTVRVLDPRKSFALVHTLTLPDFPYSMGVAGGLALVGCGDGGLHVVDIKEGRTLYALGAHQGCAVRCIEACEDRLFSSGDDGNTMLWTFPATAADAGS